MPNVRRRNKQSAPAGPAGRRGLATTGAHSVKDLLSRATPDLTRVTDQAQRQAFWVGWLAERLPPALRDRVSGAVERDGTLTVLADSPAWAARLRFEVSELEAEIRATAGRITSVRVRVLPAPKR